MGQMLSTRAGLEKYHSVWSQKYRMWAWKVVENESRRQTSGEGQGCGGLTIAAQLIAPAQILLKQTTWKDTEKLNLITPFKHLLQNSQLIPDIPTLKAWKD